MPCLLFQLPFEAVTGIQNLAYPPCMIVMGLLFLLASFGAVHQVVRRWFSQASSAAYLLSVAAIVLGSQLYYLFVRPYIYEYAIVCGTSLLMLALWFWLSAANTAVERRGALLAKLALGSLCMALVAGCRPRWNCLPCWPCPSSGSDTSPKSGCAAAPGQGKRPPSCCLWCWWPQV